MLLSLRDMDIFHLNHKDKDIFFESAGNFKDWGYSEPPYTPPLSLFHPRNVIEVWTSISTLLLKPTYFTLVNGKSP